MNYRSISRFFMGTLAGALSAGAVATQWQALPETAPSPADNPTTSAKVELGKMLYFDPRFSATGTVSCDSCHNVMEGGDDHRSTSMGVHGKIGGRNAPTVYNAAFHSAQFWDGRAASLEEQAKGPVVNPVEMGMENLDSAVDRLRAIPGYQEHFAQAFGGENPITADNAAKAVAAYERTLITPNSPYDRYVKGEKAVLSEQQVRGMETFDQLGCTSCHAGANFDGPSLPPGQPVLMKFPTFPDNNPYVAEYHLLDDKGRAVETGKTEDEHLWRVPTLRNLGYTAPYFHNGSVKDLGEAVRVMAKSQLNKELSDAQVADVVAFLGALDGTFPVQTMPRLPATPGDLLP